MADRRWQLGFFVVLAAAVALAAFLIGRGGDDEGAKPPAGATTTSPQQTIPEDWLTYEDKDAGFSMSHPPDWRVLAGPDPAGPLGEPITQRVVLTPGGGEAVKVQAGRLPVRIEDEEAAKIQSDQIYNRLIAPEVLLSHQQGQFTSNGMPGYFYTYSFRDGASGGQGLHLHYFLYRGNVIYSMVFQALPANLAQPADLERFGKLAPVFVAMAESFKSSLPAR